MSRADIVSWHLRCHWVRDINYLLALLVSAASDALPVAPTLIIPPVLSIRGAPVTLLPLPGRRFPRRITAVVAAIALACLPGDEIAVRTLSADYAAFSVEVPDCDRPVSGFFVGSIGIDGRGGLSF